MAKKTKQTSRIRAANVRRPLWWLVGAVLLAVTAGAGFRIWDKPAAASRPDPSKLIGRWLRPDGRYVLVLSDPSPDGRLTAVYFNPRPINVERAEWKLKDGHLTAFAELRDKGYPGSTYTLVYQPGTDRLAGIYFQAALRQKYDVVFERIK